ncbi:hypothetical protein GIB67_009556 [Kingdonia uniflora]|uniref:DUF4378 domain-containing protein n=1 Tax=Kingdonia uniflora TaxID=39325 RepID=A0A7J7NW28_9MAGN|nr:hypothetical protein GIB67_009556 [Kingdonia uniflora]
MSAKLLHALTDDNPDLQKQIGCMTGIFQLFDRHHIAPSKRITAHGHKRVPSGHSNLNNEILASEPIIEKKLSKNAADNHRVSTESSRASFSSSSCSSSFSSFDCNKISQPEPPTFEKTILPEKPLRDSPIVNQPNVSPQLARVSLDFRDLVKDSMNRDSRGLSVKTTAKEETVSREVKHRDSPRPLQISKAVDGSFGVNGKPWYLNDGRETSRSSHDTKDRSLFQKDTPRFSYDGREVSRSSFESRDNLKFATRLKELPRLSLDSRVSSIKSSNSDAKSNFGLKDLQRNSSVNSSRTSNLQQESGTYKKPPSVVAKLMGLEELPNSISAIKTSQSEDCDPFSKSTKANNGSKQSRVSSPRTSSPRDLVSPRLTNQDSVMKPVSRLPVELAPWKQLDSAQDHYKLPMKSPNSSPSVYAEIEKRLKELEFKQSDKDLRALKQILDAMQAKGLLEKKNEVHQISNIVSQRNYDYLDQTPRAANRRNPLINRPSSPTARGASPPRAFESPIVIMKPAKLVEKSSFSIQIDGLSNIRKLRNGDPMNNRIAKDLIPKGNRTPSFNDKKPNSRTLRSARTSNGSQQLVKENTGSFGRSSSGSVSPRLQQKKLELEKRSRPPIPSSDTSKPRRQSRQPIESGSPGGKYKAKNSNSYQSQDRLSDLSPQGDEISLRSDSNISLASQIDIDVTSTDRSAESNYLYFQRSKAKKITKRNKPSQGLNEDDGPLAELITPEQPSPISVLDSSFYKDDLPSPVKKITNTFIDDETEEEGWSPVSEKSAVLNPSSDTNRKKLENVEHLVQKLRRLNSNHNEATTDYIASLCENNNPDHRYISEMLLASGLLLRNLGSCFSTFQLHPSGHPINPDLFFVLEQTNGVSKDETRLKPGQEKVHRKLVFDAVNEILVQKLAFAGLSSEPQLQNRKLAGKMIPSGQKLLKELCSEIEDLQSIGESQNSLEKLQPNVESKSSADEYDDGLKSILLKDVTSPAENWTDFNNEISGLVLDVERLIFKDLVDEIVSGEATTLRANKTSRRCRQLFTK